MQMNMKNCNDTASVTAHQRIMNKTPPLHVQHCPAP